MRGHSRVRDLSSSSSQHLSLLLGLHLIAAVLRVVVAYAVATTTKIQRLITEVDLSTCSRAVCAKICLCV